MSTLASWNEPLTRSQAAFNDTALPERALGIGHGPAVLEQVLDVYVGFAKEAPLTANEMTHPWRNIEWWLYTVVPELHHDPLNRIRWFVENIGESMNFCPSDLQDDIAHAVGEWIGMLSDAGDVEAATKLLVDANKLGQGVIEHPGISDPLWEMRGEYELGVIG